MNIETAELKECDLVMKGGITSGIVYPQAVLALKDTYRLRNIGGASAGAIAAAAAAAAEYGRGTLDAQGQDGFGRLDALNEQLCQKSFLRSLFQPSPKTRVLMEAASAAMRGDPNGPKAPRVLGKVGGVAGALARYAPVPVLLGAVAGAGVGAGLSALDGGTARGLRQGVFLGLYGLTGAAAGGAWSLLHTLFGGLKGNGFGICNGHAAKSGGDAGTSGPVLIDWLIGQIEGIAGKTETATVKGGERDGETYKVPLTFWDLKNRPNPISLKMMTTNVSEEVPYALPFDQHRFIFEEATMRTYFPDDVVDHMVTKCHKSKRGRVLPSGFFYLPEADDLPIVVAMRMSLSFPVLLSAVPLWTLGGGAFEKFKTDDHAPLVKEDLAENWFSDGGLSSNFPIHFFDGWLPNAPTFGIDLTAYPPEAFDKVTGKLLPAKFSQLRAPEGSAGRAAPRVAADPSAPVYLARADSDPPRTVNALPSLVSFLGAIVSTMQNYRDNQQSQLPSYRERIVQVRLEKTEGGLNLDMPAATLATIAGKGTAAGEALLNDFAFDEHKWTRFLVVMGQLEAELRQMRDRLDPKTPDGAKFDVAGLLTAQQRPGFPYGYPPPQDNPAAAAAWVSGVQAVLGQIEALMGSWPQPPATGPQRLFARKSPAPASNLRLTPQVYAPPSGGQSSPGGGGPTPPPPPTNEALP